MKDGNETSSCPACGKTVNEFFPEPSKLHHHICDGCGFHWIEYETRDGKIKTRLFRVNDPPIVPADPPIFELGQQ